MASMALLNEAQGETKGRSEEERVGEAGEGCGERGRSQGRRVSRMRWRGGQGEET